MVFQLNAFKTVCSSAGLSCVTTFRLLQYLVHGAAVATKQVHAFLVALLDLRSHTLCFLSHGVNHSPNVMNPKV